MIHENANSYSQTQAHHGVQILGNDSVDWNYEKLPNQNPERATECEKFKPTHDKFKCGTRD
jgi:hypothetical protein